MPLVPWKRTAHLQPTAPWQRTLYLLWAGQFCLLAGVSLIAPFLPLYLEELGVKDPRNQAIWSGVIFSAYYAVGAVFQPIWGHLADRYGRKAMAVRAALAGPRLGRAGDRYGFSKIMGWCLGAAAVIYLLQGLVTSAPQLAALRFTLGLAIGGIIPAANAQIARMLPPERRGRAFGLTMSANFWGSLVGPLIGSVTAFTFNSFRAVFPITALLMLASLAWLWLHDREADGANR